MMTFVNLDRESSVVIVVGGWVRDYCLDLLVGFVVTMGESRRIDWRG